MVNDLHGIDAQITKVLAVVPGRDVEQEGRLELGQHVDGHGGPPVLFYKIIYDALSAAAKLMRHVPS